MNFTGKTEHLVDARRVCNSDIVRQFTYEMHRRNIRNRKVAGVILLCKQALKNVVVEVGMVLAGMDAVQHEIGL